MKYISGGYYIVSRIMRPEYMDKDLIPEKIYSASECLCNIHPDINTLWGTSRSRKQEYVQLLDISESTYSEMEKWVEEMFEANKFYYPQVFTTVELAKGFFSKFLNHIADAKIIGIGLPENFIEAFLQYEKPQNKLMEEQYGIEKLLLNQTLVDEKDFRMLGYEVLGYEYGTFHSYLCNGLEKDYEKHFGFTLNENCFISSLDEAIRFCDYSNDEELGTEPVLWLPWGIFEYKNLN
ncbi:hypothetical protein QNH20_13965 [Neobacillus sp. WH10]|uniref:hypothetical protein n=1 Tax=Neobacillus sp. WH10 TaxID=3047873 RepID=UPI0024C0F741|nr:hypothetical protein [Neobacillus sp. WH10]WHY75256.1 hypothetical protein QNH20_13965 [Neobacillus sp. WH10]